MGSAVDEGVDETIEMTPFLKWEPGLDPKGADWTRAFALIGMLFGFFALVIACAMLALGGADPGPQGEPGPRGFQGPRGFSGAKGERGLQGPPGQVIEVPVESTPEPPIVICVEGEVAVPCPEQNE